MEMNGLLRRKMVVWNYSRLHTPEVGATTESNGSVATLLYLPLCSVPALCEGGGVKRPAAWIWPDRDPETKKKINDTVSELCPKDWSHPAPKEGKEGKKRRKNVKKIEVQ